jgi:hypothetical protein
MRWILSDSVAFHLSSGSSNRLQSIKVDGTAEGLMDGLDRF